MIPAAVAIGAGVSALLPLVTEMLREKPDPEAAKMLVQSKRQELIDQKIGGGLTRANAEKAVDEELGKAMAEADRQGQFNTPVGEMVAGAILGGVGGWAGGKLLSKFAPNVAKKFGMGAADEAASKVSAATSRPTGPSMADVALAQSGGMPLTRGRAVVTPGGGDVAEMLSGPFPGARAEIPLSMGKAVVPKGRAQNVDVGSMLAGGPFPG